MKQKIHVVLNTPKAFMRFWDAEIQVDDRRGKLSRERGAYLAKVVGITFDQVLVRERNEMTYWLPINNSQVEFFSK